MATGKPSFYVFECEVDNCAAEFYFNDIPLTLRGKKIGRFYNGQSNQYVVEGENEIAAVINPGPTPSQAITGENGERRAAAARDARVFARLALYPFGAVAGGPDGKELLSLEWTASKDEPIVFPRVVSASADIGYTGGRWLWQDAPRVELDDANLEDIEAFLRALHISLMAGSPDVLIETSQIRIAETEYAYQLTPGEKESLIRRVTAVDSQQPWWGMQPLIPELFDFRLCGRGRLVECIGKDWAPLLKENPDDEGGQGMYSMIVAMIDDEWTIVR